MQEVIPIDLNDLNYQFDRRLKYCILDQNNKLVISPSSLHTFFNNREKLNYVPKTQAKWKKIQNDLYGENNLAYMCSNCENEVGMGRKISVCTDYCPYCGAEMIK